MKVIPVINCQDVECVRNKIEVAKAFLAEGDLLHLDVADGSFATHKTWANPLEWVKLKSPFGVEVHLMVDHPEEYIDDWLAAGARRLIVHMESLNPQSMHEILGAAARYHVEVMLSSKPESDADDMAPYLRHFNLFQVLAVQPGPSGQKFLPFITEKIRFLREELPDVTIEVDGGMDLESARLVKDVGADMIVSSSYIFGSADPKEAYKKLSAV
jgi:ribulose-phosphate 3-epimerase